MNNDKQFIFLASLLALTVFVGSLFLLIGGAKAAILGALLMPILVFSYYFPRWGLLAFLIYLPFGGTVTYAIAGVFQAIGGKVSYTSEYPLFHLAKDAFYFPALLAILITTQSLKKILPKVKPLSIALGIFLLSCCLTLFFINFSQHFTQPGENSILMGMIGLKVLIGYIPLILCAYYWFRDRQDLSFLSRVWVTLILICCTLCIIQYFLLISGICPGSSDLPDPAFDRASLQAQCFVGGSLLYNPNLNLIRLPGTFVSPWQWSWFLISSSFITYGIAISESSRPWRWVSWIATISVLVATVLSGQRTSLLLVPIIYLVLLLLTEKRKQWLPLKIGMIVLIAVLMTSQLGIVQQQISNFVARWNYAPPPEFMARQMKWIANNLEWLGHGLGRATSAARRWGDIQLIEIFYAKVLYEIGILGFLTFLGVVTVLTLLTYRAYRSLKTPSMRSLGLCLWLFVLFMSYNPYYYPLVVDPVAVYYWFVAGMLLKLPEVEENSEFAT